MLSLKKNGFILFETILGLAISTLTLYILWIGLSHLFPILTKTPKILVETREIQAIQNTLIQDIDSAKSITISQNNLTLSLPSGTTIQYQLKNNRMQRQESSKQGQYISRQVIITNWIPEFENDYLFKFTLTTSENTYTQYCYKNTMPTP